MLGRMDSSSCDEIDGCVLDSIDNGEGTIIDGSNDGENEGSVLRDLDGGPVALTVGSPDAHAVGHLQSRSDHLNTSETVDECSCANS